MGNGSNYWNNNNNNNNNIIIIQFNEMFTATDAFRKEKKKNIK